MRLKEFTDRYDPRSRLIANCIWPTEKKPLVPIQYWYFLLGLGLGWILGICTLGLVITGG